MILNLSNIIKVMVDHHGRNVSVCYYLLLSLHFPKQYSKMLNKSRVINENVFFYASFSVSKGGRSQLETVTFSAGIITVVLKFQVVLFVINIVNSFHASSSVYSLGMAFLLGKDKQENCPKKRGRKIYEMKKRNKKLAVRPKGHCRTSLVFPLAVVKLNSDAMAFDFSFIGKFLVGILRRNIKKASHGFEDKAIPLFFFSLSVQCVS